jgi:hypothetical protein
MARFVNTAVNGRGNEVMIGGRGAAGSTHLRGWDAGVKVVPIGNKGERDEFLIYMTGGSHAAGRNTFLGTVKDTPNGPVFEPADSVLDRKGATL